MNVSDYFLPRSYSKIQSTYCFFLPPGLYSRRNWKERVKKSFLEVHKMFQTVKKLPFLEYLVIFNTTHEERSYFWGLWDDCEVCCG